MLKKVFVVFPVFIFFVFSGLFVFASSSSSVVFQGRPQVLTDEQKQDHTWEQIRSEVRNRHTYLDFHSVWKPLFIAAKDDTQYEKKGSKLGEKVKNVLLRIFAAAERKNKTGLIEYLLEYQIFFLEQQRSKWDSLVDSSAGEHHIDALLNPQYAYLTKTPISIKKGEKVYERSLEPLFLAAKRFGVLKSEKEFVEIKIPGFREIIWDFRFLSFVGEREINAAFTAADAKNKPKLNNLWAGIKDELKKPEYAHLSKTLILINNKNYGLEPLFKVAQSSFTGNGYTLPLAAKMQLQDLVNANVDDENFKVALTVTDAKNKPKLNNLWSGIKDELKKPEYAHLSKTPILINNKNYDLKLLFDAAQSSFTGNGYNLNLAAKMQLQDLVNANIDAQKLKDALAKTALDLLWSEIKSELKTKYAYLSKNPILVNGNNYNLEPLFVAAKDDTQYEKKGSELSVQAKDKLQELVNAVVISQKLKDALDVKNNENLDAFWSEIKSELKKPDYAYLVKTQILVKGNNYNLEPLFVAVKNEYRVLGSQLSDSAKNKLQSLVSADVQHQIFKTSLMTINNQKLDNLWTQLKKILNQPEFSKRKDTSIKIKNKSYDLKLLFTAKDKTTVKGSALPLDAKLQLQKLVNDQVTSKMVENQLLALNQAEAENNKQAKEKQQRQDLTIGLATGGSVLVAAGVGGFLYWFFKIRK